MKKYVYVVAFLALVFTGVSFADEQTNASDSSQTADQSVGAVCVGFIC